MIGNYSLADQLAGVGLTPLGEDVLNDPRAMQRMGNDLAGMSAYQPQGGVLLDAEPAGAVYGQQGSSFFSATPEDDTNIVVKTIGTVLGAPFNLLRGAKEGLEEVIGHPYAQQRQAMDEQYAMLASVLSDSDKTLVGMPVDRTGVNARQAYGDTVATGVAPGIAPVMAPRKTGITELLTGENRKQRALQMARLQAALKAQGIKLNIEQAQADIYSKMGAGTSAFANARKTGVETDQLETYGPQEWRGKIAKLGAETYQARAGGDANAALASQRNQMTPGMVREQNAKADDAVNAVDRNQNYWLDVTYPSGLASLRYAEDNQRMAQEKSDAEVAKGRASAYESMAKGDAATLGVDDDVARAEAIRAQNPLRMDLLRSQTDLTRGKIGTEASRQNVYDARAADIRDSAPLRRDLLGARIEDINQTGAARRDLLGAQTTLANANVSRVDEQTRAIAKMTEASIDKVRAQIGSFADTSLLAQAKMRLMEIQGGVLMSREERDAGLGEIKQSLLETKMDLERRAAETNDVLTKTRIEVARKEIEKIDSLISLNGARELAVGQESSLGGSSLMGLAKTITSGQMTGQRVMSGKEHDLIKQALTLAAENPEGAALLLRSNGFTEGVDFNLEDGAFFGMGKKKFTVPPGSIIEGSLGRVREQGSGKSFSTRTTGVGNEAATRPQAAPGQTRSTDGEVEEVFKDYGRNPKAIDAAYRAGLISESAARKAIEATGYQRAR